ncbi:NADH:ubiquinone oxidoreductase subunit N [Pseudomonas gingeri]|uniref:NADH:ubiquinone oxidoreductase subunit N n=1 Tax=Pseudomonas gingeri TaxID=117681 RepID=UPI0015A47B5F|nr:NADH:ubiquinone oxidoreductase subunit N [Pseudomonas gingeri]NWA04962.1 NADH:ubiquinone oxidoreductase subunit N [Pseudomonas gingeri]NWA17759.1 NADH:ubiquinone oxidoreductase subunit N [Pseudomonas gingeri]NWA59201.1 NADH:ubiquinone oxidoreductase subunit N [Pseudomonas gingeri]NWA99397.1 NADH:ubiquinone oxidoreductase subunit N [Pseudomonas gingeri]NWB04619.1 NADH:ubiquinone oxidoreductase subunit N [Pseudomonas gingeri]
MKNPYAPGFWCAVVALVLLSATYFYGVMLAHQIDKALVFLDSASALIAVMSIVVVAWASYQSQQVKKRQLSQSKTLVLVWDTKVALRRVETVFDRYFWGSYWQPGRTFQEVMGELTGTPLEKSLETLKSQCLKLDHEVAHEERHWLSNARELADVAIAMARERYQLDVCDPRNDSPDGVVINRDFEVLVYTWTARLKTFDHQLDEMELQYS